MFRFIALPSYKCFHILILIYEQKIIYKVILIDIRLKIDNME
jgi:hypothetical protein